MKSLLFLSHHRVSHGACFLKRNRGAQGGARRPLSQRVEALESGVKLDFIGRLIKSATLSLIIWSVAFVAFSAKAHADEALKVLSPVVTIFAQGDIPRFEAPQSRLGARAKAQRLDSRKLRGKKRPNRKSLFPGLWLATVRLKRNSCYGDINPSFNIGFNISSKLVGTDIADGSPFFTGQVFDGDSIIFGRARTRYDGCRITQTLSLNGVRRSNGTMGIVSELSCPQGGRCSVVYSGAARRR